jgi:uncharacterized repeat protein (TIGR03943 family)
VAAIPLVLGLAIPSRPLGAAELDEDLSVSGLGTANTQAPVGAETPSALYEPSPVINTEHQPTPVNLVEARATAVVASEWTIYDWQDAYQSGQYVPSWFNGKPADVTGMVVRPEGVPAGHFVLGRWVMRHCAADAFGVGLLVKSDKPGLSNETWVRAQGSLSVRNVNNEQVLVLDAASVDDTIEEPVVPYIFPRPRSWQR